MSWAPYFHPSGAYIIFTANKLGFDNFELLLVDAAGARDPVRVTFTDGFDGLPVFSPDGQKLCWTTSRTTDKRSQLFLARWNHSAALRALEAAPPRNPASAPPASPGISGANKETDSAARAEVRLTTAITESDLRADVEFLASDALEGRHTGEPGAQKAADFLVEHLKRAGLKPFGGSSDYRLPFEFTAGVKALPEKNQLTVSVSGEPASAFDAEKDFRPLSFTANDAFEGEVVFAGYGLAVPEGAAH